MLTYLITYPLYKRKEKIGPFGPACAGSSDMPKQQAEPSRALKKERFKNPKKKAKTQIVENLGKT